MTDTFLQGALLATTTSLFWSFAPFFFASAGKKLGPYYMNLWRLTFATGLLVFTLAIYMCIVKEPLFFPTISGLVWLITSGILGLLVGDWFYFKALYIMGPRRTLQTLTFAPVFSTIIAWLWLNEQLKLKAIAGLMLTVGALYAVTLKDSHKRDIAEPGIFSNIGFVFALCGAFFQGSATVLIRQAYRTDPHLDTIVATTIRIGVSSLLLWLLVLVRGHAIEGIKRIKDSKVTLRLMGGALFGPVGGMLCYVSSLKFAPAGIVSILTSLSPIIIIGITAWRYKTKLNFYALVAMLLAIFGVTLIFWH